MKTKNVFLVIAVWFVLLLPGLVLAQNDFDQSLGQSTQSGQGNEITIHDPERATIGTSEDEGQDPQSRVIRFGDDQPTQGGSQQYQPPKWETREGVEEAAKAYFQAKNDYNQCKRQGDTAGMRRADARMTAQSRKLENFQKEQAKRDAEQDARLNKHSELVWKHESQLNNQKTGLVPRVEKLEGEMNAITPAIAGVDGKFNTIYWWLLFLTVIVIIGFGRRYYLSATTRENRS